MKTQKWMVAALAALWGMGLFAEVAWKNVDAEHYRGGRKASAGYLQGKVVLVDRWGVRCPPCCAMLPRVEEVWQSFKSKPFAVLGGHCAGWGDADGIKALVDENNLTYSIYEDAGLAVDEPKFTGIPFLYVVDETGRLRYRGHDIHRATEVIVTALTDMAAPRNLAFWKYFLDFEITTLPAKALNRYEAFKKKFPAEAKDYAAKMKAIQSLADIKAIAALVAFAEKARDTAPFTAKQKTAAAKFKKSVEEAIEKNEKYKTHADARVAQEVKNAIADLKWKLAEL